eukprot:4530128-Amphidinium_carterae.1
MQSQHREVQSSPPRPPQLQEETAYWTKWMASSADCLLPRSHSSPQCTKPGSAPHCGCNMGA